MEYLTRDGLVEGIKYANAWGKSPILISVSTIQITPLGIEYLSENSTMKKVASGLSDIASVASLFV